MRILVVAVGRLRPPYVDDVQHYQRMLARHAKVELVEVREEEQVEKRIPARAFTCLLDVDGTAYDSVGFSRFLEERRMSGQDLCFVIGGPYGLTLPPGTSHKISLGPMTLPAPARTRRHAGTALPGAQDPRRRALPPLMTNLELRPFLRRFAVVVLALVVLLAGGTIGYVTFEGVGARDGFLWALDTIATEGARNQPDTVGGEITWVLLIVLGVGTLLYALVTLVELLVSGRLRTLLDERREQRAIDSLTDHVIICGYGRVGRQVARDLRAAGERYVVIDERHEHAEDARHVGVRFIEGSASDDEALLDAGIDRARAVIACVDSDAENVFIVLSARQLNAGIAIIARASTVGAGPKRSPADGRTIGDVRGDAIIVAVRHADGSFLPQPPGDPGLHAADVILALGRVHTLERLEATLGPRRSAATP